MTGPGSPGGSPPGEPKKAIPWEEMGIPIVAVLYALATVIDQSVRGMEFKTLLYSLVLAGALLLAVLGCLIQTVRKRVAKEENPEKLREMAQGRKRILIFMAWAAIFAVAFEFLGYVISIPIMMYILFLWLGMKSKLLALAFSLGMPLAVFFVFDRWAQMDLPLGPLSRILN
ncbi:MAG: tripartite tricarboxylate transporter TctB family protein [Deltaproteobacteria bacterium]|jgi:cellulose synthase/poly-beta-1,6-N-acetylglucosamine synthase-like glycosyltransferase|nr:tripartite tricarboxylate transporter TctB family protein [Deltaproteobacteria bacterium]